jgi:glycosyltransferase involved in cell wall biosynthesis
MAARPRRVTLVADELLGYVRTGGIGTATTHLALAAARMGHDVEVLYAGDGDADDEWDARYAEAGVAVRRVERSRDRIEPSYLARARDVELGLAERPPDVVVTQDLAAPAYTALRKRDLGLGFAHTLFVVYCHGTRRWISDTARKARVLPGAHAITLLEEASIELADVAVAPSSYVLEWMRGEGWCIPDDGVVIPYLSGSTASGEAPARAEAADGLPRRLAFFGRIEERKGLRPFAAGVNALEPELLRQVELSFVGALTPAWPPERVLALFSDETRAAVRHISFESTLDQPDALAAISRPGTLVVMPSLGETFSNAVYECLERSIPFIASDAGAPRELVAAEDHEAVLFEPTADGVATALRAALTRPLRAARLAFDPEDAYRRWDELLQREPRPRKRHGGEESFDLRLHDVDDPAHDLHDRLAAAQAASGADVVTCGIRLPSGDSRLFIGDCGGLGAARNAYGTVGLVRRDLLVDAPSEDWLLYARLAVGGAKIVSVPEVLATVGAEPREDSETALAVAREFERVLPRTHRSLARLVAGLAAQAEQPARAERRRLTGLLRR